MLKNDNYFEKPIDDDGAINFLFVKHKKFEYEPPVPGNPLATGVYLGWLSFS